MPGLSNASGGGAANVRAGRAYVELFARDSGVLRALERVKSKFQALGSTLIKSGAAVGGLGAAVTAGFKPALDALADTGKIGDLADLFQLPAEKASRLFGIMAAGARTCATPRRGSPPSTSASTTRSPGRARKPRTCSSSSGSGRRSSRAWTRPSAFTSSSTRSRPRTRRSGSSGC
ncbi:hypothetical protein VT84_37680 [Gemmata sp. SH-PL17]|uniref:hypothetical protein n=1 Tax=Gemmata sp. SH-PL17 TaxID=1630693 RepID=UPI00078BE80D|nr:hypothetical protein [Gemmata sp. SH-PL17]AMV30184.1 hypothetical protein VT84_37680 [Gemmata sp. SH-PL17]